MNFSSLLRVIAFDWPLFLVILALAIFYTIITKGLPFTKAKLIARETLGVIRERPFNTSSRVSAIQATMIGLCGTVGAGSIIGVTAGILLGGPGAILWMWGFGLLGMALKFAEATLAVHYRRIYTDGSTFGGPFMYLARGLERRGGWLLGGLFALLATLAAFVVGNLGQVAGAASALDASFGIPAVFWSLLLAVVTLIIIGGGTVRVARVAQALFPLMLLVYGLLCLALILKNLGGLGAALLSMLSHVLSYQAAAAGGLSYGLQVVIAQGLGRGIFATGAGLGISSIAHAQAQVDHPVRQGFWGVTEVFIALIVSSLTALSMLSVPSLWQNNLGGAPAEVIRAVFSGLGAEFDPSGALIGSNDLLVAIGSSGAAVATFLFALGTMIAWAFYAEESAAFLLGDAVRWPVRLIWTAVAFLAPVVVVHYNDFLGVAEIMVGLMSIPNIIALAVLNPVVAGLTRGFFRGEPYNASDDGGIGDVFHDYEFHLN